jgi:hypothetical protein
MAIRLAGWDTLARQIEVMAQSAGAAYVAADGYALGSELAWFMPDQIPVIGVDEHWAFTRLPRPDPAGRVGLLLRDARNTAAPDPSRWPDAERVGVVHRPGGAPGAYVVYRITTADMTGPVAALPHR